MTNGQRVFEALIASMEQAATRGDMTPRLSEGWEAQPAMLKAAWEAAAAAVLPKTVYIVGHPDGTIEDEAYLSEEQAKKRAEFNGRRWGTGAFKVVP
jgi:hypothetical protein